ncbi:hypothetical protein ElyMa_001232900 [Elysia marginata]|uniref:Uncharacterized protein n=1 Tax=Elysia marginata TaxID=1093978 RepID=A0AAV4I8J2_9GAST|nr:hypothetical protein ElyMa_001232900 [Elysia marginata]
MTTYLGLKSHAAVLTGSNWVVPVSLARSMVAMRSSPVLSQADISSLNTDLPVTNLGGEQRARKEGLLCDSVHGPCTDMYLNTRAFHKSSR